jgi:fibronectin type 3 domain-containing protein
MSHQGIVVSKAVPSGVLLPTTDQHYDVIRLIQAMFNGAPGKMYLDEFAGHVANGMTMNELANLLAQTDAFKLPQLYPSSLDSHQFAVKLVDNLVGTTTHLLNRTWLISVIVDRLDNGYSQGEVIWFLISALKQVPVTDHDWGRTAAQFANKVDVAYYYSVTMAQSSSDIGTLQAVTRSVSDDPATVIIAKATKPVNLAPSWATLGITGASRQITVSWAKTAKNSSTTNSYNMYWSKTPGVTKKTGAKIANVSSPYTHTGLTNGTTYYYVVTEVVAGAEGPESQEAAANPTTVVPLAPIGVNLYPMETSVRITIDRTEATATTKFNLYWSTSPTMTNATKISNAFGSTTSFLHNGLKTGTMIYYAVAAESPEGEGPRSKTVATTPLADMYATNYQINVSSAQLAAPKAVNANTSNQQVTLAWEMPINNQIPTSYSPDAEPTKPPVITAYKIYWSTTRITDLNAANKLTVPATSSLTFIHNTGLTNNQPYYYLVAAEATTDTDGLPLITADGRTLAFESPPSGQIMVVPQAKVPFAPTGLSATAGIQQITLAWTASSTKGGTYRVYVSDKAPAKPEDLVLPQNLVVITSQTSHTHTALQNGITYYYVVTAVTEGESAPTSAVSIKLF